MNSIDGSDSAPPKPPLSKRKQRERKFCGGFGWMEKSEKQGFDKEGVALFAMFFFVLLCVFLSPSLPVKFLSKTLLSSFYLVPNLVIVLLFGTWVGLIGWRENAQLFWDL